MRTASINLEELFTRVENDRRLLATLIALYRDDAPRMLDTIDRACHERDSVALLRAAHALKGATSVFAAAVAVAYADEMEQAARDLNWVRATAMQHALSAEVAILMSDLASLSAPNACAP